MTGSPLVRSARGLVRAGRNGGRPGSAPSARPAGPSVKPSAGRRRRPRRSARPTRRARSARSGPACSLAKSRIRTAETSEIMPRPYCAAAPDSCRSWVTPTLVPRPARASVAVTTMLAWPRPFSSAPARVHDHALGRLVALGDIRGAGELQPDRAHPDGDPALVLLVAEVLGQLRARQAGGHLRDVVEELPDLLDRLGDLEVVLDQHRVSPSGRRRDLSRTPGSSRRSRSSRSRPSCSQRQAGRVRRHRHPADRVDGLGELRGSVRRQAGAAARAARRTRAAGPARPGWRPPSPRGSSGRGPGQRAPAPGPAGPWARPARRGSRARPRPGGGSATRPR